MTLTPMASMGTPMTMAGRVQARKSGSSARLSSAMIASGKKTDRGQNNDQTAPQTADDLGATQGRDQPASERQAEGEGGPGRPEGKKGGAHQAPPVMRLTISAAPKTTMIPSTTMAARRRSNRPNIQRMPTTTTARTANSRAVLPV